MATARLTGLKTNAGFEAPANAALANASASEASARLSTQSAEVDLGIKALVRWEPPGFAGEALEV